MSGSEENSIRPEKIMITMPTKVQTDVSFKSWAGVWCRMPKFRRRKSTIAMVPTGQSEPDGFVDALKNRECER